MKNIYSIINELDKKRKEAALCIIVSTKGSVPRKIGAKMLVHTNGEIEGTIGGGELEKNVIKNAIKVLDEKKPRLFKHDLLHQHNMCCGGTVEIYIEPIMKKNKLYIFGAGHTGCALAKLASQIDYETVLIDDRKELLEKVKDVSINKMNLPIEQALPLLPFDENTFVCIMTYSHPLDRDILAYCIKKSFAYLGMIGSQRKIEMTKKNFVEGSIASKEELEKVDMPMGINIRAEGPEEIAVSILAKLIEVKNTVLV